MKVFYEAVSGLTPFSRRLDTAKRILDHHVVENMWLLWTGKEQS